MRLGIGLETWQSLDRPNGEQDELQDALNRLSSVYDDLTQLAFDASAPDQIRTRAIETLRRVGSCVVVMAHRPSAIAAVNKVLMLHDGKQLEFGTKDEVLKKVTRPEPARNLQPAQ